MELGHVDCFLLHCTVSNRLSMVADLAPNCLKRPQLIDQVVVIYYEQGATKSGAEVVYLFVGRFEFFVERQYRVWRRVGTVLP
jgi:hypothetical protein